MASAVNRRHGFCERHGDLEILARLHKEALCEGFWLRMQFFFPYF